MSRQSFKELIVWQKAMEMVTDVYKATMNFPDSEKYGLTSQIRRCAVSVPSNIAEGHGRRTDGEFLQFLGHARGSLCELETQLLVASNVGFLNDTSPLFGQIEEVGKILTGLRKSVRNRKNQKS